MMRIMSASAYDRGKVTKARQDGSREVISLLACICADGTALPPTLIYKGDSGDLQDTWVDEVSYGDQAYFGASSNGWSSDAFGFTWLTKVFQRHTYQKAGKGYRLLIVDGHSSHVNMEFTSKCEELKIIVLILPPHSTHRLQPLDVGFFLPLSNEYTTELNLFLHNGGGIVEMTKRNFWPIFRKAWGQAKTTYNILHSFEKAGIYPINKNVTIPIIKPESPPPPTSILLTGNKIKTPYTSKALRRLKLEFRQNPNPEITEKLFKAALTNAAQTDIQLYRSKGLEKALKIEKKKRTRSKR
ncbi:hypothetical protein DID88_008773 [Monilinia fructigena]|uniref:DDE-1 domain-containing protein n=1 Tax=Monilinia fructigena TaxID=38457 RepID=A0A395J6H3_9HELO|nr:hypothetical protein DID88_008773 [Monilinia fructigena]